MSNAAAKQTEEYEEYDGPILETVLADPARGTAAVMALVERQGASQKGAKEKVVVGDPQLLAELGVVKDKVREFKNLTDGGNWDIGNVLRDVHQRRTYRALGEKNFDRYCEKEHNLDGRDARLYIDFATNFSRDLFVRLGFRRSRAMLTLLRATPEDDTIDQLINAQLRHGSGKEKPISEASTEEILESARGERGALQPKQVIPPDLAEMVSRLQSALGDTGQVQLGDVPANGELPKELGFQFKAVRASDLRRFAMNLLAFADQIDPS